MLVVVGLVILGPERLPGAVNWFFTSLRQVRDYATGATGAFDMTRQIVAAAGTMGITVHDHLIIGKSRELSFRGTGLL